MVTKAEREEALAKSIADAIAFAAAHGHEAGPFVRRPKRYVAAAAECVRCHGQIVVDSKGVLGIPRHCA